MSGGPPIGAVLTSIPDGRPAFNAPCRRLRVVVGDLDRVVEMTDLDGPGAGEQRDVGAGDAHLIFSADAGVPDKPRRHIQLSLSIYLSLFNSVGGCWQPLITDSNKQSGSDRDCQREEWEAWPLGEPSFRAFVPS